MHVGYRDQRAELLQPACGAAPTYVRTYFQLHVELARSVYVATYSDVHAELLLLAAGATPTCTRCFSRFHAGLLRPACGATPSYMHDKEYLKLQVG